MGKAKNKTEPTEPSKVKHILVMNHRNPVQIVLAGAVLLAILSALILPPVVRGTKKQPETITVSGLQKIINVSELSTFTAVYNGIAQVMNEKDPEKVDYYVSYDAKVNAGIDFEKIEIEVDHDTKTIYLTIPNIYITDTNVDISSLDFIFNNKKANTSTVTQAAFKACEADVQRECEQQDAIFNLARQNAENVLTALVQPLIEQVDATYELVMQ